MTDLAYRELARRLDALPNGFPPTESGVELRLLRYIFEPEEAALASGMSATPALAQEIALQAGLELAQARRLLKGMVRKGLLGVHREQEGLRFHLIPWVIGIYENQLPRLDAELASLVEAYFKEVGALGYASPPIHRVLPVGEAIPFELGIYVHDEARALIENAKSWGVRNCICRVQQKLVGKGCDRPVENCLVFAPVEQAFTNSPVDRAISKEEALRILQEAEDAGLVHTTGNWRDGHSYICNCCTCCCGVLRGLAEFHSPTAVANSGYRASVDAALCVGCGACLERCQFGALAMPADVCEVDGNRCVGCGLCATVCPAEALSLVRLSESPFLPANVQAWGEARQQSRGRR